MPRPFSAEKPTIGTSLTWANDASSRSASLRQARLALAWSSARRSVLLTAITSGAALVDHPAGDGEILLVGHVGGVEDHDHDVGQPDGVERVGHGGSLELGLDAAAPAHAGGVDQAHRPALPFPFDADGVARDAGLGAGQHPLLADQPVEQGRLADIGPADDRQQQGPLGIDRFVFLVALGFLVFLGHRLDVPGQRLVQVAQALAVLGRHRDRIAQSQRVRLGQALLAGAALAFVGDHDHLVGALAQPAREALVERHDARPRIDQEQHGVGAVDRPLGEAAHARLQRLAARRLPARRIEQREGEVAELRRRLAHVTGHARRVVDDGAALADQAVEQRRLADIGPADDGHPRKGRLVCQRRAMSRPESVKT